MDPNSIASARKAMHTGTYEATAMEEQFKMLHQSKVAKELEMKGKIEYQVAGRKSGTSASATMNGPRDDLEYKILFIGYLFDILEQ